MSIFDRIRKGATQAADQHGDKISRGLDKAAKSVDERTGHKHSGKIRKGVGKAKEGLSRLESKPDRGGQSPGDTPPGTTPPGSGPSSPPDTGGSTPPR
jgi:MT0933-like antitoxin protein